jgi:AcrR family transcriptional regulator
MTVDDSIVSSFKRLLLKHRYGNITVEMVCKEACVSRKTFYNHFHGKEAIFKKIIHDDIIVPLEEIRNLLPTKKIKSAGLLLIEKIYEEFYAQEPLFMRMRSGPDITLLRETLYDEILSMNKKIMSGFTADDVELEYLTSFCAASNTFFITKWIADGMVVPPKQVAHFFYKWVMRNLDEYTNDEVRQPKLRPAARA